jgi:predicted TIM-barrel fold metal-dependent hydrolase
MKQCYIVDADAHVNPPPGMWAEYLPTALQGRAPVIEHGEDCDYVVFEGRRKKVNLIAAQAGRSGKDFKMEGRLADARTGGWMPAARLADMDKDGIAAAVLFGGGPLGTLDEDLYLESFAAYNRWVMDFCTADAKRLAAVAYIPMMDVEQSIKMLREAAKAGMKAVNIPAFPQSGLKKEGANAQQIALTGDPQGSRQYRDPEFDPFWAAAVDLGMPITFHLGARVSRYEDKINFLPDLVMTKTAMCEPIAIMIFGGVFDRFPELKVAQIEGGVGWMAWAASYMDRTWSMQRHWTGSPLKELPSFYMDRNIYGSFIHDPVGVALRHFSGGKNIMWSSDYPHSETTFPHSLDVIEQNFAGVPEAERDWIISGCAKQFFRIA